MLCLGHAPMQLSPDESSLASSSRAADVPHPAYTGLKYVSSKFDYADTDTEDRLNS